MCIFNMLSIGTLQEMHEASGITFVIHDGCITDAVKGSEDFSVDSR